MEKTLYHGVFFGYSPLSSLRLQVGTGGEKVQHAARATGSQRSWTARSKRRIPGWPHTTPIEAQGGSPGCGNAESSRSTECRRGLRSSTTAPISTPPLLLGADEVPTTLLRSVLQEFDCRLRNGIWSVEASAAKQIQPVAWPVCFKSSTRVQ